MYTEGTTLGNTIKKSTNGTTYNASKPVTIAPTQVPKAPAPTTRAILFFCDFIVR